MRERKYMSLICLLLIVCLLLNLAGCAAGGKQKPSQDGAATEATAGVTDPTDATDDSSLMGPITTAPTTEPTAETDPVETEATEGTTPIETEPKGNGNEATGSATAPTETPAPTTAPTQPAPTEAPHTHSYKASGTTAATCTSDGYTTYRCSCGDSYKGDTVKATGHSWGEWKTTKEATTSSEGQEARTCSKCGSTETRAIAKLPETIDIVAKQREIADLIVKYINEYRTTKATKLPRFTLVAEYRARQLTTNFAHDEDDLREACAYYQYGRYVDMTEYGGDADQNHWTFGGGEAISHTNASENADPEVIARRFADACYNSSGHWRYVGKAENAYIGVGLEYKDGEWYCCICVSEVNYG